MNIFNSFLASTFFRGDGRTNENDSVGPSGGNIHHNQQQHNANTNSSYRQQQHERENNSPFDEIQNSLNNTVAGLNSEFLNSLWRLGNPFGTGRNEAQQTINQFQPQHGEVTHTKKIPPASSYVLRNLPTLITTAEDLVDPNNRQCSICFNEIALRQRVIRLIPYCGHTFCSRECILPWLEKTGTCPVCRYELPTDAGEQYESERQQRMARRKPRLAKHELFRLTITQLKQLILLQNARRGQKQLLPHFCDKQDMIDHILSAGDYYVDWIAAPDPVRYTSSELNGMAVSKLKKVMNEEAGVFFEKKDIVEKQDLLHYFLMSGRLEIIPDNNECNNTSSTKKKNHDCEESFHTEDLDNNDYIEKKKRSLVHVETVLEDDDEDIKKNCAMSTQDERQNQDVLMEENLLFINSNGKVRLDTNQQQEDENYSELKQTEGSENQILPEGVDQVRSVDVAEVLDPCDAKKYHHKNRQKIPYATSMTSNSAEADEILQVLDSQCLGNDHERNQTFTLSAPSGTNERINAGATGAESPCQEITEIIPAFETLVDDDVMFGNADFQSEKCINYVQQLETRNDNRFGPPTDSTIKSNDDRNFSDLKEDCSDLREDPSSIRVVAHFQDRSISDLKALALELGIDLTGCVERNDVIDRVAKAISSPSNNNRARLYEVGAERLFNILASEVLDESNLQTVFTLFNIEPRTDVDHVQPSKEDMMVKLYQASRDQPKVYHFLQSLEPLANATIAELRMLARHWNVDVCDCLEKKEMIQRLLLSKISNFSAS